MRILLAVYFPKRHEAAQRGGVNCSGHLLVIERFCEIDLPHIYANLLRIRSIKNTFFKKFVFDLEGLPRN